MQSMTARILKFAAALGTIVAATATLWPAIAKEEYWPEIIQPASPWQVTREDNSCRLTRSFVRTGGNIFLSLESDAPSNSFTLLIAGEALGTDIRRRFDLAFGPDAAVMERETINSNFNEFGSGIITGATLQWGPFASDTPWLIKSEEELAAKQNGRKPTGAKFSQALTVSQEAAINWFEIRSRNRRTIRLALGPMNQPMEEMRGCIDELLVKLGLDISHFKIGILESPTPTASLREWFSSFTYSDAATIEKHPGMASFRLIVGSDGRPESCYLERSPRPADFDNAICKQLMKEARFEPAIGADGQPIRWYYRGGIGIG